MASYSRTVRLLLFVLFIIFEWASCQELRVGVLPGAPIALNDTQAFYGFGIDIWDQTVKEMNENFNYNVTYKLLPLESMRDMANQLFKNEIDLAIYAVVPAPNLYRVLNSTVPYLTTVIHTVSRVTPSNGTTFALVWRMFLDSTFLAFLLIICMFSIICAHVIWHVEKKRGNPDFPANYKYGIGHSLYWAWSTISLVGFGDVHVGSGVGKGFTVFVVIFSLVLLNVFAGIVCSFVTTNSIAPVAPTRDAFSGVPVAALRNSYCEYFLQMVNAQIIQAADLPEGIELVRNGTATYFVAEQSSLIVNLTAYDDIKIEMSGPSFDNLNYTFMYSNSPKFSAEFARDLDRSITLLQLSDEFTNLTTSYFPSEPFPTPYIGFMREWGPALFFFLAIALWFVWMVVYHFMAQKALLPAEPHPHNHIELHHHITQANLITKHEEEAPHK